MEQESQEAPRAVFRGDRGEVMGLGLTTVLVGSRGLQGIVPDTTRKLADFWEMGC